MTTENVLEIMKARHSVRRYLDRPIEPEIVAALEKEVAECNAASGLHLQMFTQEPEAFAANRLSYGMIRGCWNYFALVGPENADEAIGYWGERLVLKAQELGLNTCWVAMTFHRSKVKPVIENGEKFYLIIALGYGKTQGVPHKSRPVEKLSNITPDAPEWFRRGMEGALLAPTAINEQKFFFEQKESIVRATAGKGRYAIMDLGIVKYHFEVAAGKENFQWG